MHVFRKKIYSLHTALRKATRKGGKCLKKLLDEWQFGRKYIFKVYYNEVDVVNLRDENEELRGQKRNLEESLVEQEVKRLRVEEKYRDALSKAEKKGIYYKKRFKCMAKKVSKMIRESKGRGPAKKKKFSDYSRQHQTRLKREMKVECQSTLAFLGLHNFVATKVEVLNAETNQYETFNLVEVDHELEFTDSGTKELTNDDLDNINMWLYLKDKFNISNEAWHEISMKAADVPNKHAIGKRIKELNNNWNLKPTPGRAEGIQIGFEESLKEQIVRMQNKGELRGGETLKIKISGDGTNIGKRLKVVNFTYTILNEKDVAMAEKGNYVLAVMKSTEEYDDLRDNLEDLRKEMANLKEINVNGYNFKIEYFLGGDWKFLALVCGLGKANQELRACGASARVVSAGTPVSNGQSLIPDMEQDLSRK